MFKWPYILTILALVGAASPITVGDAQHVDLSTRTWCRLRPYGNLESLPIQKHRLSFTGLIEGRDPPPDRASIVIERDGKALTRRSFLDDVDGPDQFVFDPRFLKIYVSGFDAAARYGATYQPGATTERETADADFRILRKGSAERRSVPLIIDEPAGIDRRQYPVTFGFPVPIGELATDRQMRVLSPQGRPVPGQFRATGYWPDGSVKWVTIDFQANVRARRRAEYGIEYGHAIEPSSAASPLTVRDSDERIEIDTGPLQFALSKSRFSLFEHVSLDVDGNRRHTDDETIVTGHPPGGATLSEPPRASYLDASTCRVIDEWRPSLEHAPEIATDYGTADRPPERVTIEETGPMRAVVRVQGWHVAADGAKWLAYDARYHAYAGHSMVRVFYTFTNAHDDQVRGWIRSNLKDGNGYRKKNAWWRMISRLALSVPLELDSGQVRHAFGIDDGAVHEGAAAGAPVEIFQSAHDRFRLYESDRPIAKGRRFGGWMHLGDDRFGMTVAVRHGWQQQPKSLITHGTTAILELWPQRSQPHFDCYRGMAKRHEVLFHFHPGQSGSVAASRVAAAFEHPLIAPTPPAWVQSTKALGEVGAFNPDLFRPYESSMDDGLASYVNRRRNLLPQRHYGMRDYGDSFCGAYRASTASGGIRNWSNWDDPEGNAWINLEYDGTLTFVHEFARRGTRPWFHEAEIAGRHWMDIDHVHFPAHRAGAQYAHGPEHVGQKAGAGGHAWIDGLLAFGHLFADRRATEVAMSHGRFKLRKTLPPAVEMHRGYGWPALAFVSLYADTWDQRYLEAARHYIEGFLDSPVSGEWPYHEIQRDLTEGRGWMMQVVGLSVIEYFRVTGDPRCREAIIQYAERVLDDFTPTQVTRHTSFPWVVEVLAMAFELTRDDRFLTRADRIFGQRIYGSSNPKQMAFTTKRMPAAMSMMSPWLPRGPRAWLIRSDAAGADSRPGYRLTVAERPVMGRHAVQLSRLNGRSVRSIRAFELDEPEWLAPDVEIEADPLASGAACVRFGESPDSNRPNRLSFSLAEDGEYRLAVRVRLDPKSQPIRFRIDGGPWLSVSSEDRHASWRWRVASPAVALSSGRHVLEFAGGSEAAADLMALIPDGFAAMFIVPQGVELAGDRPETVDVELANPRTPALRVPVEWASLPPAVRVDRRQHLLVAPAESADETRFTIRARKAANQVALQCAQEQVALSAGARQSIDAVVHNQSDSTLRGRIHWAALPAGVRSVPTSVSTSLQPGERVQVRMALVATGLAPTAATTSHILGSFGGGPAWSRSEVRRPVRIGVSATGDTIALEAERPDVRGAGRIVTMEQAASGGFFLRCMASAQARCTWGFTADRKADYFIWTLVRWPPTFNVRDLGTDAEYRVDFNIDRDHDTVPLVDPPGHDREKWHWLRAASSVSLDPGPHYVELVNRIAYVDLDRLVLTHDPNWQPPGETEVRP